MREQPVMLEREAELRELDRLLKPVEDGEGTLALIEGPAGIGKTTLLQELRARARQKGLGVLAARCGELEREFAFGVVRQLLEPRVARLGDSERERAMSGVAGLAGAVLAGVPEPAAAPAGASAEATLHGLYWLVANLAEREPLVLAIDDAQWADEPSVHFLEYLARRLAGLAVLVAVAARSDDPGGRPERLRAIAAGGLVLRPAALSPQAVRSLARQRLGSAAPEDVCDACHPASGGNPFLLGELLTALRERVDHGGELNAGDVPAIEARGVVALVAGRLASVGGAASELATALAVLGDGTELHEVAALARVTFEAAAQAADGLADATIVSPARPLAFLHPLLRAAVYGQLGASERAGLHGRAARLLADSGASSEAIAGHLLEAEPGADPWVVETLRDAARTSLGRGAPQVAASCLKRALAEPPPAAARADVLVELGTAEDLSGNPEGIEHLQRALQATPPGARFAYAARALAFALIPRGRLEEAVGVLDTAIAQLPDAERELALELEAVAATAGRLDRRTFARTAERLHPFEGTLMGETAAERLLLANLALQQVVGGTAREAAAIAQRALDAGLLADPAAAAGSPTVYDAVFAALTADAFEVAGRYCDGGVADARSRGSSREAGVFLMFRANLAYRQGRIGDAEADASAALDLLVETGHIVAATATGFLIDALIERGEHDAATDALARVRGDGDIPDTWMTNWLLYSRGRLRIAKGSVDDGLSDLELLGSREQGFLGSNPSVYPYRSSIALVLARQGESDRARALADEELGLARAWGTPRPIGIALRALGCAESGKDGIERLRESVSMLEASGARLEHARAVVELGAALRRAGARVEARDRLAAGMDLAHRCSATVLAEQAREELVAAGAKPRRMALSGLDSLTASERRVARMAAEGMTNKEIAQALFVTVRTVEMHLGNTYRKLDISSRDELRPQLGSSG